MNDACVSTKYRTKFVDDIRPMCDFLSTLCPRHLTDPDTVIHSIPKKKEISNKEMWKIFAAKKILSLFDVWSFIGVWFESLCLVSLKAQGVFGSLLQASNKQNPTHTTKNHYIFLPSFHCLNAIFKCDLLTEWNERVCVYVRVLSCGMAFFFYFFTFLRTLCP